MDERDEEKKQENQINELKRKNKESLIRVISISFLILALVILTIVKFNNKDFPLIYIGLIGGGSVIIFLIMFFSNKIKEKINERKENKKKIEIPTKSTDEATKYAQTLTINKEYTDYIISPFIKQIYTVGKTMKSKIFVYASKGVFEKTTKYYVIINMQNFKQYTILLNLKQGELKNAINNLAKEMNPEEEREITRVENLLTGTKSETIRTKPSGKREQIKSHKTGELKE